MNSPRKARTVDTQKTEYATVEDFRKLFTMEMESLYLLALLLTVDDRKAEASFVAGIEDSVNSSKVFREWARSWAKRQIIKNAVAAIQPRPGKSSSASETRLLKNRLAGMLQIGSVLALDDFERFVFVLSVLERYSEKECSLLLDCSMVEVHSARIAALRQVAVKSSLVIGSAQGPKTERLEYAIQ